MKTKFQKNSVKGSLVITCRKAAGMVSILLLSFFAVTAQKGKCECCLPAFGSITLYHSYQPGSMVGFGMEAGKWNVQDGRFSYFLGTKLQWLNMNENAAKVNNGSKDNNRFTLYMKGQFRVVDRVYLILSPGFVNLTSFEAAAGLRYAFPLSRVIGVGLEPTYSIVQKQFSINTNIHFALEN